MRTLLLIMNPRQIPECVQALEALTIDKAWLSNYTEAELVNVIADTIESTDYDRYALISDDTSPTQEALDLVLSLHDENPSGVACGWVNVDECSTLTTFNPLPLVGDIPEPSAYSLTPYTELLDLPTTPLRTYFHGMALVTMTRSMWQAYPFDVYGADRGGWASDYHQCIRLQADYVPIVTHKHAYIRHHKAVANQYDHSRPLLVGKHPQSIRFATVGNTPTPPQGA